MFEPMLARQQWRVANNSHPYPTLAQRLLPIWDGRVLKTVFNYYYFEHFVHFVHCMIKFDHLKRSICWHQTIVHVSIKFEKLQNIKMTNYDNKSMDQYLMQWFVFYSKISICQPDSMADQYLYNIFMNMINSKHFSLRRLVSLKACNFSIDFLQTIFIIAETHRIKFMPPT